MIFLDAAGIGDPRHEPYIVVAGIIIDADKQWKVISQYLSDLADLIAPAEHRNGFAFHATELFSGGKIFPRDKFEKEWRWKVLDELVALPGVFGLPIVWARVPRSEVEENGKYRVRLWAGMSGVVHGQVMALGAVCSLAERWLKENTADDEIAQMIMENDDQSRKAFSVAQRLLSDPQFNSNFATEHEHFRLTKIIYPMHFEEKTDSSALQIADACAFALKRWCMGAPEAERFYAPLRPYLVAALRPDLEAALVSRASGGQHS